MEDDFMIVSGGVRYRPEDADRLKLKADPPPTPVAEQPDVPADDPAAIDPGADDPAGSDPDTSAGKDEDQADADQGDVGDASAEKKATPRNKARTAQNKAGE